MNQSKQILSIGTPLPGKVLLPSGKRDHELQLMGEVVP
jgi:hypothetical protein